MFRYEKSFAKYGYVLYNIKMATKMKNIFETTRLRLYTKVTNISITFNIQIVLEQACGLYELCKA